MPSVTFHIKLHYGMIKSIVEKVNNNVSKNKNKNKNRSYPPANTFR